MEEALLGGESTGGGRKDKKIGHRSDAIAYGSSCQKAAALVDLCPIRAALQLSFPMYVRSLRHSLHETRKAEDGIGLPEKILDQPYFTKAVKFYFMFIWFDIIWSLSYVALVALNFFEKPLWCAQSTEDVCGDREYFFLGQLPYLTSTQTLICEGLTLSILIFHTAFPISYEGSKIFFRNPLNQAKVGCLLVLVADLLVYCLFLSPVAFNSIPFRVAPYIRVVILILNIRELRATSLLLAGMLGTYLNVLALLAFFLLFSSWVAYVMFEDTPQGKIEFTSYGSTLYKLFLLYTTTNNPAVWIPAYKVSRWYCLFFVIYLLLGVYFITNLILAVVYDSFKSQLAKQVSEMDTMRVAMLKRAFKLLDEYNVGFLDKEQCIRLFEELNKYRTLPKISRQEFELIFKALDDSHDFKINMDEFADLCNAIALRFPKEDAISIFEKFPSIYHSPFSKALKSFVQSPVFGYIISSILIVNLVAVVIETTLDIENNTGQKIWQGVEFVFGWIYMLEMTLKIYSFGFQNYWRDDQNRFDFLITWIIVIGETITFISPNGLEFLSNGEWIRYLLLARMLRLMRLLMYVKRYRAFVATFLTLIPSLMPYLGVICSVLCIYCSLGEQIFGGIVNAGNSKLAETDLAANDYLLFNFNDYPNGMVTLFNLLVMSNWQIWMESYKELTGTSWTLVYFISFYLISVLLLLNLVVAFVLEAFFTEMDLESLGNGEEHDKDSDGKRDIFRSVGTKTRSQRVDVLLHHMLSAELDRARCSKE